MGSDLSVNSWPPKEATIKGERQDNNNKYRELRKQAAKFEAAHKSLIAEAEKYEKITSTEKTATPELDEDDNEEDSSTSRTPSKEESENQLSEAGSATCESKQESDDINQDGDVEESQSSDPNAEEKITDWLQELVDDNDIVFVSKQNCPFSAAVKKILAIAEVDFEEIKSDSLEEEKCFMLLQVIEDTWKRFGLPVLWISQSPTDTNELRQMVENGTLAAIHNKQFIRKMHAELKDEDEELIDEVEDEESSETTEPVEEVTQIEISPSMSHLRPNPPLCVERSTSLLAVDLTNVFVEIGANKIVELCTAFVEGLTDDTEIINIYIKKGFSRRKIVQKLSGFLCERFGGPEGVTDQAATQGCPSILCCPAMLVMRHNHLELSATISARWLSVMISAINSTIPSHVAPLLEQYFRETIKLFHSHNTTDDVIKNKDADHSPKTSPRSTKNSPRAAVT